MQNQEILRSIAENRINSSKHAAAEIAKAATENPLNLRDVDALLETSFRIRPWQLIVKMLDNGAALAEIEEHSLNGAMHEARYPSNSTSPLYTMARRSEASAWAEAWELVRKLQKGGK